MGQGQHKRLRGRQRRRAKNTPNNENTKQNITKTKQTRTSGGVADVEMQSTGGTIDLIERGQGNTANKNTDRVAGYPGHYLSSGLVVKACYESATANRLRIDRNSSCMHVITRGWQSASHFFRGRRSRRIIVLCGVDEIK